VLCSVSEKRLTDVLLAALESVRGNQTAASSVGLVTDFRRVYSKAVALSKAMADALIPHSEDLTPAILSSSQLETET
jgi:hypothetical protein